MGNEVDERHSYVSWKIGCLCGSRRYLLFRIILRNILVKETIFDARINLFKWTDFKRLRAPYGFCLFIVFSTQKQTQTLKNQVNYRRSSRNWEKIHHRKPSFRFNWNKLQIDDSIHWMRCGQAVSCSRNQ